MNIAERADLPLAEHRITSELSEWLAGHSSSDIPADARVWARHALLDWFGVTIAGVSEPLVDLLIEDVRDEHGSDGPCTVVGSDLKTSADSAALINGSASHALDYDDVNRRLMGHPTVPVAPVVLALAERNGLSGKSVLDAFIAGTEVECLIGQMAGYGHYDLGFHNTATIGTFGAAAAAARVYGLDAQATARAFGIAASQAAGLKSNFGTMTKPLHAGKAAANGLLAARLASRGFTANEGIIECAQGIAAVGMPGFVPGATAPNPDGYFAVQQTLFKHHAACYLIHASIEAVNAIRTREGIGLDDLKTMTLQVKPDNFKVCNIGDPTTGLEIKFSIRHCVVMALAGVDTASLDAYSDANALDARFAAARAVTEAQGNEDIDRMAAHVRIALKDGRVFEAEHDAGVAATDVKRQAERLDAKFRSLCTPVIGAERTETIIREVDQLETAPNLERLMAAAGGSA